MRKRKVNTKIPRGIYCYDENGLCPHWSRVSDMPEQENGYCSYLAMGDWDFDHLGLLWDQVKECDANRLEPFPDEYLILTRYKGHDDRHVVAVPEGSNLIEHTKRLRGIVEIVPPGNWHYDENESPVKDWE